MVKKFIATIGAILALNGCTSVQPIIESDRTFERVVNAPGYKKEQIYNSTKIWIAENFKSAKAVIELDSKEEGILIGNGIIKYPCDGMECLAKSDWKVPFTMRVDIKDQKFKISFSNIKLSWPASSSSGIISPAYDGPINLQDDMNKIKPVLLKFADDIMTSMNSNKNDW